MFYWVSARLSRRANIGMLATSLVSIGLLKRQRGYKGSGKGIEGRKMQDYAMI